MRPPTPQILHFGGGFWILDFGDFGFWGVWILDFGAGIPNPKSKIPKIQNPKSPKSPKSGQKSLDFGFWGFWILGILDFWDFGDFGFWGFWILDFGDFGFWIFGILGILDFGFLEHYVADLYVQSLDFGIWGFWILDFGLGILDVHLVTKFWMLHKKKKLCTPNRVGGFSEVVNGHRIFVEDETVNLHILCLFVCKGVRFDLFF